MWYWRAGQRVVSLFRECPHLPELLACVLATDTLQDLSSSWVLVHELGHLVDTAIDDDVQTLVWGAVLADLAGGE